jgi:hypothetical protein
VTRAAAPSDVLAGLEAWVRAVVRDELARAGVASDEYTSSALPPGVNARTFARWCRSGRVAGAERDGSGWRCSVAAWREARAAGGRRAAPTETAAPKPENDVESMLRSSGLRATR